ncbi:hypothetical protein [Actinomadura sp. B10D3]|uniref:hypothetical protein n=1 Tax=Actinomadura sp. B10D3 TaxID=3153557 RepID=UPI00325D5E9D
MTRRTRARSIAGAVVVAAALATAAGCGEPAPSGTSGTGSSGAPGGGPVTSTPSAIRISATVTGGKVRTAHRRVKVPRGATVEITITSDTADEFHLHGYDRELDLPAGRPATLRFTAGTPGVFEAELHHSGTRVFELQVG